MSALRSPAALMAGASLCFALMGVAVKAGSPHYSAGELVLYRSIVGLALMLVVMRLRGVSPRTRRLPLHLGRSVSGTAALCLWFYAIGVLPLATAMTLNYMSSVWIALFLIGGAVLLSPGSAGSTADAQRLDGRLVAAVLAGFAGVALVLRPTIAQEQLWGGVVGLLSGMLSALAYLQVTALGKAGEPGERVVFYFSTTGVLAGAGLAVAMGGFNAHTPRGLALLGAIGVLATMGQWMMTRAYARGATLGVAALQYLGIAWAFLFGVWLFDEAVTGPALLGILLIVGAGVFATLVRARVAPRAGAQDTPT